MVGCCVILPGKDQNAVEQLLKINSKNCQSPPILSPFFALQDRRLAIVNDHIVRAVVQVTVSDHMTLFQSVSVTTWALCRNTVMAPTASVTRLQGNAYVFPTSSGRTVTAVPPTRGSWPAEKAVNCANVMLLVPSDHLVMR